MDEKLRIDRIIKTMQRMRDEAAAGGELFILVARPNLEGLLDEIARLRPHAAAWRRLCAIDKERQATHRRPMVPRGVMDEVNGIALGKE
jgi:hypothetical protein